MVAGHLREQNGYFQMILSWKNIDGIRKSKSISTGLPVKGNKKRAEAMLLKARREFNPDNLLENANIPFSDFLMKWLKDRGASLGAATYTTYAYDVKNYIFPYFRDHTISVVNVTPKDLEGFYQYELQDDDASAEELLQFHEAITACLNYAKELGWIKENPAEEVNPCADQAPIRFDEFILEWLEIMKTKLGATIYNQEELDQLFKAVKGDPLELAVILGTFYGLRRSEVVGLKWDAIDFQRKTINIRHTVVQFTIEGKTLVVQKDTTKTKSSCRTLPLVESFEILLRHLKEQQSINQKLCGNCYCKDYLDYIYVDAMGSLVKPNFITQHFAQVLRKNNLKKIRFHDLRHSCASLLYANGVALKDIQEWLGRSDIGTTSNIYTHLDYSNKVSSANAILPAYPQNTQIGAIGQ